MTPVDATPVAVCAATFRRPVGLERMLRGLDGLVFPRSGAVNPVVVVVDNDPDGSARSTCDRLRPELRWELRYVHEPTRGLSSVRNRAVAEARDWAEFIAFIDDDEAPEPEWLDQLLQTLRAYAADVVVGPQLRRFEEPAPRWIERGRFFEDPRYPTGTRLEHGSTGNCLIRTEALAGMAAPFDERLSFAGGEDTHLFLRMHESGRSIVWADEAIVHEWIPASRANALWILKRVYRTSNTWGMCEREIRPSPRTALLRIAKGGARIGYGLVTLPLSVLRGRHAVIRSLWYICLGAGHLSGTIGVRYHEYRVTHGR